MKPDQLPPTPNSRKNLLQKILTEKGPVDNFGKPIEVQPPTPVPDTKFIPIDTSTKLPAQAPIEVPAAKSLPDTKFVPINMPEPKVQAPIEVQPPTPVPDTKFVPIDMSLPPMQAPVGITAQEPAPELTEIQGGAELESIPINSDTRKHILSIIQESLGQWYGKEASDDDIRRMLEDPILSEKLDVILDTPDRNQPELPDGETRQVIGLLASALLLLEVEWKESDKLGAYAIGRIVQPGAYSGSNQKRITEMFSFMGTQNRMFPGQPFTRETSEVWFSQQWDTDAIFEFVAVIFNKLNPIIDSPPSFNKFRLPQLIAKIQQIQEQMPLHGEEANNLMDKIKTLLIPPAEIPTNP